MCVSSLTVPPPALHVYLSYTFGYAQWNPLSIKVFCEGCARGIHGTVTKKEPK